MKRISDKVAAIIILFAVIAVLSAGGYVYFWSQDYIKNAGGQNHLEAYSLTRQTGISLSQATVVAIIAGGLILLMALLAVFFINRIISTPLTKLAEDIKKIHNNKFEGQINIDREDEIGDLSKAFSSALIEIRYLYNNLNRKVAEKTKELDEKVVVTEEKNKKLENAQKAAINILEDVKELEVTAVTEKDRVAAIVNSIGEGLVAIDERYQITQINKTAAELFDVTVAEAAGKDLTKIIAIFKKDRELPIEERPVTKALKTGKTVQADVGDNFFLKTMAGKVFPVGFVISPLKKGGRIIGDIVIFRDISEEQSLDSAKTNFISVASHQLRTPLTAMRWFSEMLMDGDAGKLSQEQERFVEKINDSTKRMADLINLLLQIARVEAGRVTVEPSLMSLKDITEEAVGSIKPLLKAKIQEVKIMCDPDPFPSILLDKDIIWQVIINLLSNANRYGSIKSTIEVSITKKGKSAQYAIKNQGIGIPDNRKEKIFEKFFRAENAIKLVPEGSGLGLNLVKTIVLGWGGETWFDSEENRGATFYFTIPLSGMKAHKGEVKINI